VSYDLMVFDPEVAPKRREDFLKWYDEQVAWEEPHSYDSPEVSTPRLRAWFMEMIETYPAMNGPHALQELPADEASLTDYSVGRFVIYAGFSWSKTEPAYDQVFRLAEKYGLGFFDVSSDQAQMWLPSSEGKLSVAHSTV
jgi:hypothetical protein